ncbi:hypothetical protein A2U01_0090317, partial [Trifolium medium]|nr:hypothetical protein [Trifolium medium]
WLKEDDVEEVVTTGWALERELDITDRIRCCADELQR